MADDQRIRDWSFGLADGARIFLLGSERSIIGSGTLDGISWWVGRCGEGMVDSDCGGARRGRYFQDESHYGSSADVGASNSPNMWDDRHIHVSNRSDDGDEKPPSERSMGCFSRPSATHSMASVAWFVDVFLGAYCFSIAPFARTAHRAARLDWLAQSLDGVELSHLATNLGGSGASNLNETTLA